MPYITEQNREQLQPVLEPLIDFIFDDKLASNPGPINYIITKICHAYIQGNGYYNYNGFNEMIGILDCVKAEFYRTVVAKYEDEKKKLNGNISELDN